MEETGSGAPAVESSAPAAEVSTSTEVAAPVAAATPAAEPAPDSTPEVQVGAASDNVGGTQNASLADAAPAFSWPTTTEFDFSSWDGKVDTFPEDARDFLSGMHKYSSKARDQYRQDLSEIRALYTSTDEDPRVLDLQRDLDKHKGDLGTVKEEYSDYKKQVQAALERDAQSYVDDFKRRHADVFADQKLQDACSELVGAGWKPEVAVMMVKQGQAVQEQAKGLKARGAPDELAYELATGGTKATPNKRSAGHSPSASRVAGSSGAKNPESVKGLGKGASLAEANRYAIERAARKFGLS